MKHKTGKQHRFAVCATLAASLCGGCTVGGGDLLFLSSADGDLDIYVAGEGETRRLTDNDYDDLHASWSPDGSRIAYTAMQRGNPDIYVVKSNGRDLRRLTEAPGLDAFPAWSPDSEEIAFVSTRNRREQIYVVGADGKGFRALTPDALGANLPAWSPDGQSLAYLESTEGGRASLAVVDRSGRNHRRLVDDDAGSMNGISWSPNGGRILYSARRHKNVDIYSVDVTTGDESRLTTDRWIDTEPVWSPDGRQIAWLSARDDTTRRQVSVMNADGSDQRNVSRSGVEEMQPQWSPDGKQIAYAGHKDRHFVVYVLDLASGQRSQAAAGLSTGSQLQPFFNPRRKTSPLVDTGVAAGTEKANRFSAAQVGDKARPHTGGGT